MCVRRGGGSGNSRQENLELLRDPSKEEAGVQGKLLNEDWLAEETKLFKELRLRGQYVREPMAS